MVAIKWVKTEVRVEMIYRQSTGSSRRHRWRDHSRGAVRFLSKSCFPSPVILRRKLQEWSPKFEVFQDGFFKYAVDSFDS